MDDLVRREDVLKALEEVFQKFNIGWNSDGKCFEGSFGREVPEIINEIPTAFNVPEAVRKMKDAKNEACKRMLTSDEQDTEYCVAMNRAIRIVLGKE